MVANADFSDANLSGADFSDANLIGVGLSGATLRDVVFSSGTDLENADLSEAILFDTDLSVVDLSVVRDVEWCRWDETTVWPAGFSPPEDLDGEEPDDLEDGQ